MYSVLHWPQHKGQVLMVRLRQLEKPLGNILPPRLNSQEYICPEFGTMDIPSLLHIVQGFNWVSKKEITRYYAVIIYLVTSC